VNFRPFIRGTDYGVPVRLIISGSLATEKKYNRHDNPEKNRGATRYFDHTQMIDPTRKTKSFHCRFDPAQRKTLRKIAEYFDL